MLQSGVVGQLGILWLALCLFTFSVTVRGGGAVVDIMVSPLLIYL